jgi:signal transduction histidine kinase
LISIFRGDNRKDSRSSFSKTPSLKNINDNELNKTIKKDYLKQMAIKKTNANEKGNERYLAIKIRVIDTGIGITKEGIKKLFIDFGKLDENSKRNS